MTPALQIEHNSSAKVATARASALSPDVLPVETA